MKITVSKDAAEELEAAAAGYEDEEGGLGVRLLDAFEHAIQLLREPNPPLTPILGNAASLGARKLMLHRFPFSLVILHFQQVMIIIAFAHHSRRPGYWAERVSR